MWFRLSVIIRMLVSFSIRGRRLGATRSIPSTTPSSNPSVSSFLFQFLSNAGRRFPQGLSRLPNGLGVPNIKPQAIDIFPQKASRRIHAANLPDNDGRQMGLFAALGGFGIVVLFAGGDNRAKLHIALAAIDEAAAAAQDVVLVGVANRTKAHRGDFEDGAIVLFLIVAAVVVSVSVIVIVATSSGVVAAAGLLLFARGRPQRLDYQSRRLTALSLSSLHGIAAATVIIIAKRKRRRRAGVGHTGRLVAYRLGWKEKRLLLGYVDVGVQNNNNEFFERIIL